MNEHHQVRVDLTLRSFDCHPDDISTLFDLIPKRSWLPGEPRVPGARIQHKTTGWEFGFVGTDVHFVTTALEQIVETFTPKIDLFTKIPGDYSIQCAVVLYMSCGSSLKLPSANISEAVVHFLSKINASVDLDLYLLP